MFHAVLLLSAALGTASAPAPHVAQIDHHGDRYEVTYNPHVRTRMKTVGIAAGTRMSTQRCRWSAELQVSRAVRRVGEAQAQPVHILPHTRTVEGSRAGDCSLARRAIAAEQAVRVAQLQQDVVQLANDDRPALLAHLAAARAVAAN